MTEQTIPTPSPEAQLPDEESTSLAPAAAAGRDRESTRADELFGAPPVDIFEDEDGLVVLADLPGIASEGLDVRVEQRTLTITAHAQPAPSGTALHLEYELTSFFRQFQLPEEVDTTRIQAELKQGVLRLRLPRAPKEPPRRVEVRTG
jgi:HSP20 family molecular chaperone IbpA